MRHPMLPYKYQLTEEEAMEQLREKFADDAEKIAEDFRKAFPEKALLDVLVMDYSTRYGSLDHVAQRSLPEGAAPVYSCMLSQEFPVNNGRPAWHCADVPLFLHSAMQLPF